MDSVFNPTHRSRKIPTLLVMAYQGESGWCIRYHDNRVDFYDNRDGFHKDYVRLPTHPDRRLMKVPVSWDSLGEILMGQCRVVGIPPNSNVYDVSVKTIQNESVVVVTIQNDQFDVVNNGCIIPTLTKWSVERVD